MCYRLGHCSLFQHYWHASVLAQCLTIMNACYVSNTQIVLEVFLNHKLSQHHCIKKVLMQARYVINQRTSQIRIFHITSILKLNSTFFLLHIEYASKWRPYAVLCLLHQFFCSNTQLLVTQLNPFKDFSLCLVKITVCCASTCIFWLRIMTNALKEHFQRKKITSFRKPFQTLQIIPCTLSEITILFFN